jgi:Tol biopolymer transport system component
VPESWSPNGDALLFAQTKGGRSTLWSDGFREKTAAAFGGIESFDPINSVSSPDGQWVAYTVREMDQQTHTIFVQPFPATGTKHQISKDDDGHHPIWSPDGKALIYIPGPSRLCAVAVTTQPVFAVGNPETLPRGAIGIGTGPGNVRNHDMTPDGSRFVGIVLSSMAGESGSANQVQVAVNWFEELKRLVPVK